MSICSYTALREKEVINLCDGRRLGFVCDLEFSLCDGRINALVVPGESALFGFGRCESITVPWEKIETIGADAILVRVELPPCRPLCGEEKKQRKSNLFG